MMQRRTFWLLLLLLVAGARLCHLDIVWVEEGYPLAAAREMLAGKALYRDVWFDKPPLFPATYLTTAGQHGLPLRLLGIAWVMLSAWTCGWAARRTWGKNSELWAAGLCAFYLTFDAAAAVMALTPDLLTIPLQAVALGAAATGLPLLAGAAAGIALGFNTKALLVLAAVMLWQWRRTHVVLAGFVLPVLLVAAWLGMTGALTAYWQQVWEWGARYSADPPVESSLWDGIRRTLNWAGFHAALFCALTAWKREWRWLAAVAIGVLAAWLGWRFFPRYYFHALPALVLAASAALAGMPRQRTVCCLALLTIPLVRFGPRYAELGLECLRGETHQWRDLAMFESSREAARHIRGGGLLVWGYRPELYSLTGLGAGTPFLDSQPLNGVLADRHLTSAKVSMDEVARRNRSRLRQVQPPEWLADGLSPYNPALDPLKIEDLREWMSRYVLVAEVPGYRIYRLAQ